MEENTTPNPTGGQKAGTDEVRRISFTPSIQSAAVRRRVTFTFSDGVMMNLVYMADATVNATIAGVADKLWAYRHNCPEGAFPASGDMTGMDWVNVGQAFRQELGA